MTHAGTGVAREISDEGETNGNGPVVGRQFWQCGRGWIPACDGGGGCWAGAIQVVAG